MKHTPSTNSPFRIHVRDLVRRPGTHREFHKVIELPEAFGTEMIGIPAGATSELDIQCEVVTDGMWVSGSFTGVATGECSRCLEPVSFDVDVPVQGMFTYPDASFGEDDASDDVYDFDGEAIELEGVVRDAVVTSLPFIPLCDPDCPGLCDQCGARLADDADHAHEILDPRWSALQSVKDDITSSYKEES